MAALAVEREARAAANQGWRHRREQVHSAFKHAADDLGEIADKYCASPPRRTSGGLTAPHQRAASSSVTASAPRITARTPIDGRTPAVLQSARPPLQRRRAPQLATPAASPWTPSPGATQEPTAGAAGAAAQAAAQAAAHAETAAAAAAGAAGEVAAAAMVASVTVAWCAAEAPVGSLSQERLSAIELPLRRKEAALRALEARLTRSGGSSGGGGGGGRGGRGGGGGRRGGGRDGGGSGEQAAAAQRDTLRREVTMLRNDLDAEMASVTHQVGLQPACSRPATACVHAAPPVAAPPVTLPLHHRYIAVTLPPRLLPRRDHVTT